MSLNEKKDLEKGRQTKEPNDYIELKESDSLIKRDINKTKNPTKSIKKNPNHKKQKINIKEQINENDFLISKPSKAFQTSSLSQKTQNAKPENNLKSNFSHITYGIIISLGGLYFGFSLGMFNNFLKPYLIKIHSITNSEKQKEIGSNIGFFFFLGCLFSSLFASLIY